ncbi:DUF4190 domain-containing protein [Demequina sp. NBRC 110055]|uniref:DUF4190 domain-containing protein n=1 Tax=Demequina sp. NBRC 110055 TaxID=1570344 RepID=UPI000A07028F|nr:DUF4190 domain-containing protein [Demequina sp. NBRC 110055]
MTDVPPPPGGQPPYNGGQPPYGGMTPPPPGGYGAPPPPGGFGGASEEKNNLGVWALVLGILTFVCCGIFSAIAAIIVGKKSMEAADQGLATNGTLGKVGYILGWVGVALSVVGIVLYAILFVAGIATNDFSY